MITNSVDNENLKHNPLRLHSADAAVDYIYDHLDAFLLLINCSQETSVKDWFTDFVAEETLASQRIQGKWKDAGILSRDLNADFISIISTSYFRCIFDAVGSGMDREKMKKFVDAISIYYTGGWQAMARVQKNRTGGYNDYDAI